MQKSFENPLYKIGPYLSIMSYFDYAHMAAIVTRRLSKTCRDSTLKWENALSESCKRLTVFINEYNSHIFEEYCKFREIKFLDLEIEIRRGATMESFKRVLLFFKDLKDLDISNFNTLLLSNQNLEKSRLNYISQNYISIKKINTIPLKSDGEIEELLRYLCPKVFCTPAKYQPTIIVVNHTDSGENADNETFNNIFIPSEIESKRKYDPSYDLLHIIFTDGSCDAKMLLSNQNIRATRLVIEGNGELDAECADSFVNNKVYSECLKYFHLIMPQSKNSFIYGLLTKGVEIKELEEFAIKYEFNMLPNLLENLEISKRSQFDQVFPSLNKLVLIEQNLLPKLGYKIDTSYFGLSGENDYLFALADQNQFEITFKKECNILSNSKVYSLKDSSENLIKAICSKLIAIKSSYVYFKLDIALDFNPKMSIQSETECDTYKVIRESSEDESFDDFQLIIEIPLKNLISTTFSIQNNHFNAEAEKYSKLTLLLESENPCAHCNLRIEGKNLQFESSVQIQNIYKISGEEMSKGFLGILSPNITTSLRVIDGRIPSYPKDKFFEKFKDCKMLNIIKLTVQLVKDESSYIFSGAIEYDDEMFDLIDSLPFIESCELTIHAQSNKKSIEDYADKMSHILASKERLRFFFYNSMELIKRQNGRVFKVNSRWNQFGKLLM